MTKKAVVLLSGGLDSSTCLGIARKEGYELYALSINYGQRSQSELAAAKRCASYFDVKAHKIVKLDLSTLGGSALTDNAIDVPDHSDDGKIPATYVPARNTIFLTIAMAYAETLQAYDIFIGCSSVDYSGYPDCRPAYFEAFEKMANLATKAGVENRPTTFHTPLIYLSKAETVLTGLECDVDYSITVTCYQADEQGRACGRCDACVLRKKGFTEAAVPDPTRYLNS